MLQRNDAHKLIEECMIAANVEAALYLLQSRRAGAVSHPRQATGIQVRRPGGIPEGIQAAHAAMGQGGAARFHARCWKRSASVPTPALLESVLLRSQSLAVYAPDNIGHFGLALEAYAHFTSPIRRYPDLLVHRAIKHALAGGKPETFTYSPHEHGGAVAAVLGALASRR
jgi:ribonuclease R